MLTPPLFFQGVFPGDALGHRLYIPLRVRAQTCRRRSRRRVNGRPWLWRGRGSGNQKQQLEAELSRSRTRSDAGAQRRSEANPRGALRLTGRGLMDVWQPQTCGVAMATGRTRRKTNRMLRLGSVIKAGESRGRVDSTSASLLRAKPGLLMSGAGLREQLSPVFTA